VIACIVITGIVSQDIAVSTVTELRLCDRWIAVWFLSGARDFSRVRKFHTVYGVHVAWWSLGMRRSVSELKRPRCKSDHSPLFDSLRLSASRAIPLNLYAFMAGLGTT